MDKLAVLRVPAPRIPIFIGGLTLLHGGLPTHQNGEVPMGHFIHPFTPRILHLYFDRKELLYLREQQTTNFMVTHNLSFYVLGIGGRANE